MPVRIVMRPRVSHHYIEESVRAKPEASAAVILRHTGHLQNEARRLSGIRFEIGAKLLFNDMRGYSLVLEHLVEKVVLPVLTKAGMESDIQQPIRAAVAKHFTSQVGKNGGFLSGGGFLDPPDHP